jgi:hypothetical protein
MKKVYASFRTKLLLVWIFSNGLMISVISQYNIGYPFLISVLLLTVFVNGIKTLGSSAYQLIRLYTRSQEHHMQSLLRRKNKAMRKQNSRDMSVNAKLIPADGFFEKLVRFFSIVVKLLAWASLFNVLFLAPVTAIVFGLWGVLTGGVSVLLMFLYPVGPVLLGGLAMLGRYLSTTEFIWFSRDGLVAKALEVDSNALGRTSRTCPAAEVEREPNSGVLVWARSVLVDQHTFTSWIYFTAVKPIVSLISLGVVGGVFFGGMAMMFSWMFPRICNDLSTSAICRGFIMVSSDGALAAMMSSSAFYYFAVPIGVLLMLTAMHFAVIADGFLRKVCSNVLGQTVESLMPFMHLHIAPNSKEPNHTDEYNEA